MLLTGELPFDFPEEADLEHHVRTTPLTFSQPCWHLAEADGGAEMAAAQEFVRRCMQVEPSSRLTARQGLQHRWFAPRVDDGQSVAIGASKAAMAALERRVASLTVTDAPKRVIRWFGRLTGRRPPSPQKQTFWELKLGMPPRPEEQEGSAREGWAHDEEVATAAWKEKTTLKPLGPVSPVLASRALSSVNAPVHAPPVHLLSARKVALDTDRAEEVAIKEGATPRLGSVPRADPHFDVENPPLPSPLPSPRRALFLAPSPRAAAMGLELEGAFKARVPAPIPLAMPLEMDMGA